MVHGSHLYVGVSVVDKVEQLVVHIADQFSRPVSGRLPTQHVLHVIRYLTNHTNITNT